MNEGQLLGILFIPLLDFLLDENLLPLTLPLREIRLHLHILVVLLAFFVLEGDLFSTKLVEFE